MVANYAGTIWAAISSLATIPIVIHFVGVSGFGLVGFYISLQALVALLDVGLSTTLNRELARASGMPSWACAARDLVRTLEVVYWSLAFAAAVAIAGAAPLIAGHWLHGPHGVNMGFIVVLIGLTIALEFPFVLYAGGLMGLQRQVELNVVNIIAATLRSFGAVAVLWLVSPTIEAFFMWQAAVSLGQSVSAAALLWFRLPGSAQRTRFRADQLKAVARFSGSVALIGILSALLTQLPRLELSGLLSLKQFGYFSVAAVIASGLYALITPVFQALFPRFAQLLSGDDQEELARLYHRGCQIVSTVVLPVATTLILFSHQALVAWTGSASTARSTELVLALLALGTGMHTLYWIPYALQLAYGWTRLAITLNTVAVIVLVPLTLTLGSQWGAAGAALGWLGLNAVYLTVGISVMHRRLLRSETRAWYLADVLAPLAGACAPILGVLLLCRMASAWPTNQLESGALLATIVSAGMLGACLCATDIRRNVLTRVAAVLSPGRSIPISEAA